jgi:subtilisin family serine protease
MRTAPLAIAILLALPGAAALAIGVDGAAKRAALGTYIVEFYEPPLATYRGDAKGLAPAFAGLKATSPAVTGKRKLDLKSAESRAYLAALGAVREDRLAQAEAQLGRALEPSFVYEVTNNGVALALSADEAAALAALPGVARVTPDWTERLATDSGPRWIHADQLWTGSAGVQTRGEGVIVGLIDSGINRTHPSFAGTGPVDAHVHLNPANRLFGRCAVAATATECNTKLIGIYDFSTGSDSQETDDGSDVSGHGTHVGSTAVGNTISAVIPVTGNPSSPRPFSGVAPHANLISYKACEKRGTNSSTCLGSWTLAAINQAVADGVDVINYSLGGESRSPWSDAGIIALLNAREAGVLAVVSAGNDGPESASIGSPGDAPWVLGVAAASHDRVVLNRLVDLTGGGSTPPGGGVLTGLGSTVGLGPRPIVIDPQFPGCSRGEDPDNNATGVSNPWPAGRFNGEIVVCERGTQARVAKSANVRLAGGGGMILVNRAVEGEQIVADAHSIPATHLGFAAGQALKTWLASGTGHSGRIEGNQIHNLPEFGDLLAVFSGRGPSASTPGIAKPDVTAPGLAIFAASGTGNGLVALQGTSMSTPHVTGAAALLVAARPSWSPTQIESALTSTARPSVFKEDAITPASVFDQGAGTVQVDGAVRAGLWFPSTPAQFRAANPASGGLPRELNRASIAHERCFRTCTATRSVADLVGGASWRVEIDLPDGASATATPATFTLGSGQSQSITFQFDVTDPGLPGRWIDGRIRFVRTAGAPASNAAIPVTLFADPGALPDRILIETGSESGFDDVTLQGLVGLPRADFRTSGLAAPQVVQPSLVQDPTRNDRYDAFGPGLHVVLLTVPPRARIGERYLITADTSSATAYDVDLFLGEDVDGDGAPESSEELCASTSERAVEHCEQSIEAAPFERRYWVLVQNWDAGVQGDADTAIANDVVRLETLLLSTAGGSGSGLTATGPGQVAALQPFNVRLAWNDPTLLPGERRVGFLSIAADKNTDATIGTVPVEVRRSASPQHAAAVLAPNAARHMRLAAGAAQDRLYLDVPPNAAALTVATSGSGEVDLYLARDAVATGPVIAPAPARGQAAGTSIHPGATESATITGAALQPGRWYVTPVNAGSTAAEFDLSVALQFGAARPVQKFGAYYNPVRSGAGMFLFPAGNGSAWSLVWYTYLQDGTPTWYLGVAPPPGAQDGVWRVAMDRYSWDGSTNLGRNVGQAQLALTSANSVTVSWNLDGESGSEPMQWIDGGGCAALAGVPSPITGMWYSPARSGFGYAIGAFPSIETNALYFYDAQGIARWALGDASPFGSGTLSLAQYSGFCPLCNFVMPTTQSIGTVTRRYDSASAGNIAVAATLRAPLQGTWNVDLPAQRITDALLCP